MGGFVVWFGAWRVNGSLAVSRSIGKSVFVAFKPMGVYTVACR